MPPRPPPPHKKKKTRKMFLKKGKHSATLPAKPFLRLLDLGELRKDST